MVPNHTVLCRMVPIHTVLCSIVLNTHPCLCNVPIHSVLCRMVPIHASPDKGQPCARITSLVISSCMLLRDFLLLHPPTTSAATQTKFLCCRPPPTPPSRMKSVSDKFSRSCETCLWPGTVTICTTIINVTIRKGGLREPVRVCLSVSK